MNFFFLIAAIIAAIIAVINSSRTCQKPFNQNIRARFSTEVSNICAALDGNECIPRIGGRSPLKYGHKFFCINSRNKYNSCLCADYSVDTHAIILVDVANLDANKFETETLHYLHQYWNSVVRYLPRVNVHTVFFANNIKKVTDQDPKSLFPNGRFPPEWANLKTTDACLAFDYAQKWLSGPPIGTSAKNKVFLYFAQNTPSIPNSLQKCQNSGKAFIIPTYAIKHNADINLQYLERDFGFFSQCVSLFESKQTHSLSSPNQIEDVFNYAITSTSDFICYGYKATPNPTEDPYHLARKITQTPTNKPTDRPTEMPTKSPTETPTKKPTENPTPSPSSKPTEKPSEMPSQTPTRKPTKKPTEIPTAGPTQRPTWYPTTKPTEHPTPSPTDVPTKKPTKKPTDMPTNSPTDVPTKKPTDKPTDKPTEMPTPSPTGSPTTKPTEMPSPSPTNKPTTNKPTEFPSAGPTGSPTTKPTEMPSPSPTNKPTTKKPTEFPSAGPTGSPTTKPTEHPTPSPTDTPTPKRPDTDIKKPPTMSQGNIRPTNPPRRNHPTVKNTHPIEPKCISASLKIYHYGYSMNWYFEINGKNVEKGYVYIKVTGPVDNWFALGLNSTGFGDTYTITLFSTGGSKSVQERELTDDGRAILLIPQTISIISRRIFSNKIHQFELKRPLTGFNHNYFTFPNKKSSFDVIYTISGTPDIGITRINFVDKCQTKTPTRSPTRRKPQMHPQFANWFMPTTKQPTNSPTLNRRWWTHTNPKDLFKN